MSLVCLSEIESSNARLSSLRKHSGTCQSHLLIVRIFFKCDKQKHYLHIVYDFPPHTKNIELAPFIQKETKFNELWSKL